MSVFSKVVVVGAGIMGHSLAVVHAQQATEVWLIDSNAAVLETARTHMHQALLTLEQAGMLNASVEAIMGRIHTGVDVSAALAGADLVVEAISESVEAKRAFFDRLLHPLHGDPIGPETLIASNTSSLDVFSLAPSALVPRLYVAHHFVPPHVIPLVEIVQAPVASAATTAKVMQYYRSLGTIPVLLKKFCPGFVINRLQAALHKEIFQFLDDGIIDAQDLDLAVKASFGIRLPVLGLVKRLDFTGLALVSNNFTRLQPEADAPECLSERIQQGYLGVHSGRGFYTYNDRPLADILRERDEKMLAIRKTLFLLRELE